MDHLYRMVVTLELERIQAEKKTILKCEKISSVIFHWFESDIEIVKSVIYF